jgi:hypothetical protein
MAYVVTAIVALVLGAIAAWLHLRRAPTTGAPTSETARVAVANAGAAAEAHSELAAHELREAPRPVIDARVAELIAKGKAP